jgi:hypothetical protein
MDGEHFLQVVSRRLGLAPPMHISKTPAARDLHAIAELLAARAPLGVALVLDAASQHLGGLVLDARHRVCADAFTPRPVRQELRLTEAGAAEAVAVVAVDAMAEARFRHGGAARVAVLVLRVGDYDVIAAVEDVARVPAPLVPATDTRESGPPTVMTLCTTSRRHIFWPPTTSALPPPRPTGWTIPVAPVELPPPPPAAVTPPSSRALTPVRAKRRFVDDDAERASKRVMCKCNRLPHVAPASKRSRSRSPSLSPRKRRYLATSMSP